MSMCHICVVLIDVNGCMYSIEQIWFVWCGRQCVRAVCVMSYSASESTFRECVVR